MNKDDLLEFNHEYGTVVPKSLQSFVDYAFINGSQYGRRIVPNSYDAFEYLGMDKKQMIYLNRDRSNVFDGKEMKEYEPEFYYDKAFCNYWKRGVEKLLEEKGIHTYERGIKDEMHRTMAVLENIMNLLIDKGVNGINLKEELKNGKLLSFNDLSFERVTLNDYAKMFIDTFFIGNQTLLDCFAYGLKYYAYARKTSINDNTVGCMFGNMYTDKQGNVVVDSPAVANMKYKKSMEMLRNFSHSYGQNQDNSKEM